MPRKEIPLTAWREGRREGSESNLVESPHTHISRSPWARVAGRSRWMQKLVSLDRVESVMDFQPMGQLGAIERQESSLVTEQLGGLLLTEASYQIEYILCTNATETKFPVEEWRRKICEWAFRVVDHFQLDRETVAIGMNCFDRFFLAHRCIDENTDPCVCPCPGCKKNVDSRTFQLAAMSCIYLSIKMQCDGGSSCPDGSRLSRPRHFRLSSFVELSRGQFTAQDIVEMEQSILSTLEWKVNPPTPMTLVSYLLNLLPFAHLSEEEHDQANLVQHVLLELARYLTELAVCLGSDLTYYRPSQLAFAAIMVAMDMLTVHALPLESRQHFYEQIVEICAWIDTPAIHYIRTRLQGAVWPDMLFDDAGSGDSTHPISVAREYGILDLDGIQQRHRVTPPTSPIRVKHHRSSSLSDSPVGVAR